VTAHRYRGYLIERVGEGKHWGITPSEKGREALPGEFRSIRAAKEAIDGALPRTTARIPDAQRKRQRLGKIANTTISEEAEAVLEEVKARGRGELAQWIDRAILEKSEREKKKRRR